MSVALTATAWAIAGWIAASLLISVGFAIGFRRGLRRGIGDVITYLREHEDIDEVIDLTDLERELLQR
jgi:hypothetical protein